MAFAVEVYSMVLFGGLGEEHRTTWQRSKAACGAIHVSCDTLQEMQSAIYRDRLALDILYEICRRKEILSVYI